MYIYVYIHSMKERVGKGATPCAANHTTDNSVMTVMIIIRCVSYIHARLSIFLQATNHKQLTQVFANKHNIILSAGGVSFASTLFCPLAASKHA